MSSPDSRTAAFSLRGTAVVLLALLLPACGIGGSGTLTPTAAPGIPTGVTVTPGNRSLTISWNPSPAAASYVVQRSSFLAGPFAPVPGATGIAQTSFKDTGLTNEQPYYYVVTAVNAFGQSPASAQAQGAPGIRVQRAASGSTHSLAILSDGSLWAWGHNRSGELGIGSAIPFSTEAVEIPLTDVIDVAAGDSFSLALRADGTVWSWGDNNGGQLGDGTNYQWPSPIKSQAPPGVVQLAARNGTVLALTSTGDVWGWGLNSSGMLGFPFAISSVLSPSQLTGLSDIQSIAVGWTFTLALKSDGTVLACGGNFGGQLGDGSTTARASFAPVQNLSGIVAIAAGLDHGVALASDGTVWVWGGTYVSNSGLGVAGGSLLPIKLSGIGSIKQVCAGFRFTTLLRSDGTVWSCGANDEGQLGNPVFKESFPLVQASSVDNINSLAMGDHHVLAIQTGGLLWGWGENTFGALGNGRSGTQLKPAPAVSLSQVAAVCNSGGFGVALRQDKSLWSWGYGLEGSLGDGLMTEITGSRVKVATTGGPTTPVALSLGPYRAFVLNSDGKVYSWGAHGQAALGNGTGVIAPVPTPTVISSLSGVTGIAAGSGGGYAIKAGGVVYGWGQNDSGEVGVGSFTSPIGTPTQLPSLSGIVAVSGGNAWAMALTSGGAVWSWGTNTLGELGNGGGSARNSPALISGLSNVIAIAAGQGFGLALLSDGTVWGWGSNANGMLGGTVGNGILPKAVPGLSSITALAAGSGHALALKSDGTVLSWGSNPFGELGNGMLDVNGTPTPTPVAGLTSAIQITAGMQSSMVLLADGTLMSWGANSYGQLANGSVGWEPFPVIISR